MRIRIAIRSLNRLKAPGTGYDAVGDSMSIAAGRIAIYHSTGSICMTLNALLSSLVLCIWPASILAGDCDMQCGGQCNPPDSYRLLENRAHVHAGQCPHSAHRPTDISGRGCVVYCAANRRLSHEATVLASVVSTSVSQDGHTPAVRR
jgi:hypothetical protein